ncbi:unnamed protein product [Arctia plantaginis]|uniref:Uncharacterized protein n=1 Tax=Arctia plantaginis TaxID=874455 RepID=A0A8S1B3R9_ARCPL|nr:unnamed protein product [Arctia plantaginis]
MQAQPMSQDMKCLFVAKQQRAASGWRATLVVRAPFVLRAHPMHASVAARAGWSKLSASILSSTFNFFLNANHDPAATK